jgi:hypothetical protein
MKTDMPWRTGLNVIYRTPLDAVFRLVSGHDFNRPHDPQVSKARPGPPTHGFGFMEVVLTQSHPSG